MTTSRSFLILVLVILCSTCSAVTRPDNVQIKNKPIIDLREYGATGDGVTDDAASLTLAIAAATERGAAIGVSTGTYFLNASFTVTCDLVGQGGSFLYGPAGGMNIAQAGVKITGLTVDGGGGNYGIWSRNSDPFSPGYDNLVIANCTVTNCRGGGIMLYSSANSVVSDCDVASISHNSTFSVSDGIGCFGCRYVTIANNDVQDFRRIGIVVDTDYGSSYTSLLPYVCCNTVHNAHDSDSSATEYNGGIWVESATGGCIEHNRIYNIGGNSGQTYGKLAGIAVTGDPERDSVFIVRGNDVSVGANYGGFPARSAGGGAVYLAQNFSRASIILEGNTLASCAPLIYIRGGMDKVTARDNIFSDTVIDVATFGILVYNQDLQRLTRLTLENNTRRDSVVHADTSSSSADINIIATAPYEIFLDSMYGYSVSMPRAFDINVGTESVFLKDSRIYLGSQIIGTATPAASIGLNARIVSADNVQFNAFPGRAFGLRFNMGFGTFKNCIFSETGTFVSTVENGVIEFSCCRWGNEKYIANQSTGTGTMLILNSCVCEGIGDGGWINQNPYDIASEVVIVTGGRVRDGGYASSTPVIFRRYSAGYSPDATLITGLVYPASYTLTNFSPATSTANATVTGF